MATEKTIRDMLTYFTDIGFRTPGPIDKIIDSWMDAFAKYTDEQLKPAVYAATDEVERWPVPSEIIKRIRALPPPDALMDGAERYVHCSKCGKWRWCRKEMPRHPDYECEDCYTGKNREQRRQRWKDLIVKMGWGPREAKKEAEAA